ncbi:MAG: zinc ribbon domain-containing protein [Candidatus Bathyarchaeia archaeon]
MSENQKCPKCGGDMVRGDRLATATRVLSSVYLAKRGDILGDGIVPYYCEKCGYIELYKEIKGVRRENAFLKKCIKCGEKIPIASEECSYCGAKQRKE